jgi:hypothetical protein
LSGGPKAVNKNRGDSLSLSMDLWQSRLDVARADGYRRQDSARSVCGSIFDRRLRHCRYLFGGNVLGQNCDHVPGQAFRDFAAEGLPVP